ncbi:MAG: flavodoxin domain-containing protein [Solirubrobacteraceae bacterium]
MRVLVTAASKHGATTEIAQAIAQTLSRRGLQAQATRIEAAPDIERYGAVVLGSAVYYGHWLRPAEEFVAQHAQTLIGRPVWLFSSGPLGDPDHLLPEGHTADIIAVRNMTRPVEHRTFAGKLEKARLSFSEKAVAAALGAPDGDFRNWSAIEAFASSIAEQLLAGPS